MISNSAYNSDLLSTLESALDIPKFLTVFSTLFGIIEEQQSKINDLEHKVSNISDYTNKFDAVEGKIHDIWHNIYGSGTGVEEKVMNQKLSPLRAFDTSIIVSQNHEPLNHRMESTDLKNQIITFLPELLRSNSKDGQLPESIVNEMLETLRKKTPTINNMNSIVEPMEFNDDREDDDDEIAPDQTFLSDFPFHNNNNKLPKSESGEMESNIDSIERIPSQWNDPVHQSDNKIGLSSVTRSVSGAPDSMAGLEHQKSLTTNLAAWKQSDEPRIDESSSNSIAYSSQTDNRTANVPKPNLDANMQNDNSNRTVRDVNHNTNEIVHQPINNNNNYNNSPAPMLMHASRPSLSNVPASITMHTSRPSVHLEAVPEFTPLIESHSNDIHRQSSKNFSRSVSSRHTISHPVTGAVSMNPSDSAPMNSTLQSYPSQSFRDLSVDSATLAPPKPVTTLKLYHHTHHHHLSASTRSITGRRRMNKDNLTLINDAKRKRICRELKLRGIFIKTSHQMLEDSRMRFSNETLKAKVDYHTALIKETQERMNLLHHTVKTDHLALRELIPTDFPEVYDQLLGLLEYIDSMGGMESFFRRSLSGDAGDGSNLIRYQLNGDLPTKVSDEIANLVRHHLNHELHVNVNNEITEMRNLINQIAHEAITKSDLTTLVSGALLHGAGNSTNCTQTPPISRTASFKKQGSADNNLIGTGEDSNGKGHNNTSRPASSQENNSRTNQTTILINHAHHPDYYFHNQLVTLIQGHVEKFYQKVEKAKQRVALSKGQVPLTAEELEKVTKSNNLMFEQKIKQTMDQIKSDMENLDVNFEMKANKLDEELFRLKELFMNSSSQGEKVLDHHEAQFMKDLVGRMSGMSFEEVVEDLRTLQKEVEEKPSETKVAQMLQIIEETFKSHLGRNVAGLKNSVDYIYKAISNKVDKDDVNKLLIAKLAQLEYVNTVGHSRGVGEADIAVPPTASTRCLSCGHRTGDPLHMGHSHSRGNHGGSLSPSNSTVVSRGGKRLTSPISSAVSQQTEMQGNELLVRSSSIDTLSVHNVPHVNNYSSSLINDEAIALMSGSVGLRPLLQQHTPMTPNIDGRASRRKSGDKIPDPLFRKAKLASHLKEMVKITTPVQGQTPNLIPSKGVYILDDNQKLPPFGSTFSHYGSNNFETVRAPSAGTDRFSRSAMGSSGYPDGNRQQNAASRGGDNIRFTDIIQEDTMYYDSNRNSPGMGSLSSSSAASLTTMPLYGGNSMVSLNSEGSPSSNVYPRPMGKKVLASAGKDLVMQSNSVKLNNYYPA